MLKFAHENRIPVNLTFPKFCELAGKACSYCGDQKTPGYECNSIWMAYGKRVFDDDAVTVCWPCRRLMGDKPKARIDQILKIAKFISATLPPDPHEEPYEPRDATKANCGKIYKLSVGDKVYIGQTTRSVWSRIQSHIKAALAQTENGNYANNYPVQVAIREGSSISFEVLEDDVPYLKLNERERYYVQKYDTLVSGLNFAMPEEKKVD
jgi:hypothetical protein